MVPFPLDPRLEADTLEVLDLPLSALRLMNDARFPWLILVPRREGATEIIDLDDAAQRALLEEIGQVSRALRELFRPEKLNVAALGNLVPQLHVHVVARHPADEAWPRPVFGVGTARPYPAVEAADVVERLRRALAP